LFLLSFQIYALDKKNEKGESEDVKKKQVVDKKRVGVERRKSVCAKE